MSPREAHFDASAFELRLSQCFEGGCLRTRELRLTDVEVNYIRTAYPGRLYPVGSGWYELRFDMPFSGAASISEVILPQ